MATQVWKPGISGHWTFADNWLSKTAPTTGDTAIVGSGNPIIGTTIVGEAIVLGGSASATSVTLTADSAIFTGSGSGPSEINTTITVTGGTPAAPLQATIDAFGSTFFDGQMFVSAMGGGLTIDVEAGGTFTFNNDPDGKAVMVVYQQSTLTFDGATVHNGGILQVEGGLDIEAGVTLDGEPAMGNDPSQAGHVLLENGGNIEIGGAIGVDQNVDFIDTTGRVTLASSAAFDGIFGFSTSADGNRMDVEGIEAASLKFVRGAHGDPGTLQLLDGQGGLLAQYRMQLIDDSYFTPLPRNQQTLDTGDFTLSSDGQGGSLITYDPDTPQVAEQSLAVPIAAAAGTRVSLASILQQSFGTAAPGFHGITLLPSQAYVNSPTNVGYWSSPNITPTWFVKGVAVTVPTEVQDIADVQLMVGNQINAPAQFQAQVTEAATGEAAGYVVYDAWSVDPAILQGMQARGFGGLPTAAAMVASAETFNATYPLVPNTDFCPWIADNVALGAGAPMPPLDASLDPVQNEEGGFWRIAYRGTGRNPVSDWSTLVKPGDVVRMGWFHPESGVASGHTTTVLGGVDASGQIRFYDNIAYVDDVEYIGIHKDNYWLRTDPADITIYRLDPNGQFLIQGSSLGEVIQGSVYNDLIEPGGGADVITTGPGRDEIQGTIAELDGIAVSDFKLGDSLDITDLAPGQASVAYSGGELHVMSGGSEVATLDIAGPGADRRYVLSADGNGGSTVQLLSTITIHGSYPAGYVISPDVGTLIIAVEAQVGGPGVSATTAHPTNVSNLGTVEALGTGITLLAGGSIMNGDRDSTSATITGKTGIEFSGPGAVVNYGTISGDTGVAIKGAATLTNFGTIQSSSQGYAVTFDDPGARLVMQSSGILGKVKGGGGTLELGRDLGGGTLDGLGDSIRGFANVRIDPRASWHFGTNVDPSVEAGTVLENQGSLFLSNRLGGKGTIVNAGEGMFFLQGSSAAIDFKGSIVNHGVLRQEFGGPGVVKADGPLVSDGTISIGFGLELTSPDASVSGVVTGSGGFTLLGGHTTFGAGTRLTVKTLALTKGAKVDFAANLSYAGAFAADKASSITIAQAQRLELSVAAELNRVTIGGSGRLQTGGSTEARMVSVVDTVQWDNSGTLVATGGVSMGAAAHLTNRAVGNFVLERGVDLLAAAGSEITNQGVMSATGGGTSVIQATTIRNTGNLQAQGGDLDLQGAVVGHGNLVINGGTLQADAGVSGGQTVLFAGNRDRLVLTQAESFGGRLESFGSGDLLDLRQFDPTTTTLTAVFREGLNQTRLGVNDASHHATLTLLGNYAAAFFHTKADGLGGTLVTYDPTHASPTPLLAAAIA